MSAVELINGDRGEAVITWAMQMADDYQQSAAELERVMINQFPHLQFWVGKRHDRALIVEWEPRS